MLCDYCLLNILNSKIGKLLFYKEFCLNVYDIFYDKW